MIADVVDDGRRNPIRYLDIFIRVEQQAHLYNSA